MVRSSTGIGDRGFVAGSDESTIQQESASNDWIVTSPLLYDYLALHELEFPSYNVTWMKGIPEEYIMFSGNDCREKGYYSKQRVLLSTHAPEGENNFIYRLEFQIPSPVFELDLNHFGEHGYQKAKSPQMSGEVVPAGRLNHQGPVYTLECCPSNPEIVLSTGDRGGVYLFDFQKQPISPVDSAMHPEAIYAGQFARCQTAGWSWLTNEISAGGDDGVICVWDSADPSQCTMKYSLHQNAVISLSWNLHHANHLISGGKDGYMYLYDIRQQEVALSQNMGSAVSALSIHPMEQFLLATACEDGVVNLWDQRNLDRPLHAFIGHSEPVTHIEWNFFNSSTFATCGGDQRVCIWNVEWIGREISEEEQLEGPPELMFVHGGHYGRVNDISWNPTSPWIVASVGEDRSLQFWELAQPLYTQIPQLQNSNTVQL